MRYNLDHDSWQNEPIGAALFQERSGRAAGAQLSGADLRDANLSAGAGGEAQGGGGLGEGTLVMTNDDDSLQSKQEKALDAKRAAIFSGVDRDLYLHKRKPRKLLGSTV